MAFEDFTIFTEVDEDGDITVSQNLIQVDTMRRDVRSYVYKDYGPDYFGDFTHDIDIDWTAVSATAATAVVWALTNNSYTITEMDSNSDGIRVFVHFDGTDYVIWLSDRVDGVYDSYTFGSSLPGKRYLTIERSGTSITCKIYTDSARTNLEATLSITGTSNAFRNLFGLMSAESESTPASTITIDVSNLELDAGGTTTTTTQSTTTSSTTTSSSTTTTGTQSTSSTTTTTVGPFPCDSYPDHWAYDAPQEWTHNESNWAGRTLRYVIPASSLRAGGAEVSIYFPWQGLDYQIGKCYIGHQAASGHEYDFDGNQVQVTFGGGNAGVTVTSPGEWSDQVAFDLDPSKSLVIAVYFVDNGIPRGPLEPNVTGYWKDGDDAATQDAMGYSLLPNYTAQRAIDIICVSSGLTTTSTTTTSSTTSSTTTSTGPGTTATTTSSSTTTSTQSTTCTTTTSGPYWSWYQDRPVFLVHPNWISPIDSGIDDPTDITVFYGKEYAYGHYKEGETTLQAEYLRADREEVMSVFDFFDLVRGRHISFWFPTWRSDIVVNTAFGAADVTLSVEDFKWEEYFEHKATAQYLFFAFPDGTTTIRKLISATATSITLDQAIGKSVSAEELGQLLVSFLLYGRFDQDEVEVEFMSSEAAKVNLSFRSLPYETPGVITSTSTTTTSSSTSSSTTSTTL